MRSENRLQWVNLWLLTLRQMTTCLTSWLRRPVVQNAASLLVGLLMTFMTTSQSNRTWSGKTSQLTSVTWLVLRELREYDRMEGVSAGIDAPWLTGWSVRNGGTLWESSVWRRQASTQAWYWVARAWRVPDMILEEHALEFGFCFNSGTHPTTILDLFRLTLVIDHE